jgi:class 3 adenylate cyclase
MGVGSSRLGAMTGRRERKVVTVLFADLAGFTSRAEVLDPEDVAALLDPYHAHLKAELERFGGTVEKFIGDAVMAIFGAPVAHEDDAERAVRAALAIRDWAADEGIELRIGINSGEALVTLEARPAEGHAMAAGDVVNTAARLQSAAPLGGILAGEHTVEATGKAIELGEETAIDAKGKTRPVRAWPVLRARARPHVERVHGAALVGRQREVELLTGALDRARQERSPELVTMVGVPGIGKSRLVLELYTAVEREPELTSWRHGRCLAYGEGITFWALGEMVKAQAGILEGDPETDVEQKLRSVVDDPWIASHLRPLVGLGGPPETGGGDRREEAFTAWRRFFEHLADDRPLVLVFEDLHWADDDLLDFVDHLTDWASGVPMLVVCTARPELLTRRPGWGGGKQNALTISLAPLSDDDTVRLLAELLEQSMLPAETQSELLVRAGGNPLYAEEFARMLREHGRIERLPETVQGLIAARLDLLEPDQKQLVQNAAVIGKAFWLGPLSLLAKVERGALERALHALERREFVRRERASTVADDTEYSFRHVLVRDVAYGQIPRAERVEKHVEAAGWLESLFRPEDHAEMLAYHYLQALELGAATGTDVEGFSDRAQAALADAGDRAFALHAQAAAGRYYRAAIDLLPDGDLRRDRLLLKLGYGLWLIGEPASGFLQQAAEGMKAAGDAEGAAEAHVRLAEQAWLAGDRDAAHKHLSSALELLEPLAPSRVKAHAIATASRFRMVAADNHAAIRIGLEALAMAEELGLEEIRAAALDNVGSARVQLNDLTGLDDLAEAVRAATAANSPFELARAKGNLGAQLWTLGRLEEAVAYWQDAGEDSARFGQIEFERWVMGVLVAPYYHLGRWKDAGVRAASFIAEIEAGKPHYLASQVYSARALIGLARGDSDNAVADTELAVSAATRAGDTQALLPTLARAAHIRHELGDTAGAASAAGEFLSALEAGEVGFARSSTHELSWTVTALGEGPRLIAALAGETRSPWARAAVAYARGEPGVAADILAETGAVTDEAYARLATARLLLEQGHRGEAGAQLDRALEFYRSVGATRYVHEAETLFAASA